MWANLIFKHNNQLIRPLTKLSGHGGWVVKFSNSSREWLLGPEFESLLGIFTKHAFDCVYMENSQALLFVISVNMSRYELRHRDL